MLAVEPHSILDRSDIFDPKYTQSKMLKPLLINEHPYADKALPKRE
jgi:hypothetical protein